MEKTERENLLDAAADWIAYNDEPGSDYSRDTKEVSKTTTVLLIADVFNVSPYALAMDIVETRKMEDL